MASFKLRKSGIKWVCRSQRSTVSWRFEPWHFVKANNEGQHSKRREVAFYPIRLGSSYWRSIVRNTCSLPKTVEKVLYEEIKPLRPVCVKRRRLENKKFDYVSFRIDLKILFIQVINFFETKSDKIFFKSIQPLVGVVRIFVLETSLKDPR